LKRSIGIDVSENRISVVQLCHGRGTVSLERMHVQQMPDDTSAKESSAARYRAAIRSAVPKGEFDTRASVVVAMPYGRVFFSNFRTDLSDNQDIRRLLSFELEDDFPILFDDLVVDFCSHRELQQHNREFLVGAVSRSELRDWIETLREAGVECSAVSADVCALHTVAALNHELIHNTHSLIIYVDGRRTILALSDKNRLVCVRYLNSGDTTEINVPALRREIDLTLRAAFNSHIPIPPRILLSGTDELVHDLSEKLPGEIDFEIEILDPFTGITCSPQPPRDGRLVIALGLALIGANRGNGMLNFLAADAVEADQTAKTKRSAFVFGFLLLAVVLVLVASLFIQLNALGNENQRIKREIRDVFTQTLPEEKRIVNELAQMTEKFMLLENEYNTLATEIRGRAPSLRILQHVSEKITPDQNVSVSGISMTAKLARLNGTATSFESVDNVVVILKQIPEFDSVEIRSIDLDPKDGKVRFSLLITMKSN